VRRSPARATRPAGLAAGEDRDAYRLSEQVGFLIRKAHQRHTALFAAGIGEDLTPTQWAALARVYETGPCSQNQLGRDTAMDVATIKGVVDRLVKRGLFAVEPDPTDARRLTISLTAQGHARVEALTAAAAAITGETLAPLSAAEQDTLVALLARIG
jgi:DNA-binding MarR family transcriptional regulator